jgi:hypothetical protein
MKVRIKMVDFDDGLMLKESRGVFGEAQNVAGQVCAARSMHHAATH